MKRRLGEHADRIAPVIDATERQRLSFAQQRLWFLDRLDPHGPVYNICHAARLRGSLDLGQLHKALDTILARHESLRTHFVTGDDEPAQVVPDRWSLDMPVIDLSGFAPAERDAEVERQSQTEAHRPFDLSRDLMLRVLILRLATDEHVLLFTVHHIASDAWSHGVFLRELAVLYEDFAAGRPPRLASLPIQYADYASWQRAWLQGETLNRQLSYWQAQLQDSPGRVALPTDRPRPAIQTFRGARCFSRTSPALLSEIKQLALEANVTLFIVLLSAFKALLFRYSGEVDISVGSGHANRHRTEIEELIGYFVNTLVLRTDLSGSPTFRELLERVRDVCFGAHESQDLPFEKLVAELDLERDLGHSPLFNVAFTLHNTPPPEFDLPGIDVTVDRVSSATAKFDLSVVCDDTAHGFLFTAEYNTDLFDEGTIARLLEHYQVLLESAVRDPDQSISRLPILTESERHRLTVHWNRTEAPHPDNVCLHEMFASQARRTPDAPAVSCEGKHLSYRELDARADRLSDRLRARGAGTGARVGLCTERSVDMLVGLLGILKAGAAYVPMDPDFPAERLQLIVDDAQIPCIVTQEALATRLEPVSADLVCVDAWHPEEDGSSPRAAKSPPPRPDDLAYIIYTSGSSGRPKGVAIEHRNLVNYVSGIVERLKFRPGWHCATVSTIAADLGNTMVFASLCTGGCLHVLSRERATDPRRFAEYFEEHAIDCLKTTPSHLAALLEDSDPVQVLPRQRLVLGGEAFPTRLVKRIQALTPTCRIFNHYGPTEATIGVCTYEIVGPPPTTVSGSVPIGRPLPNSRLYILDDRMEPAPIGVSGQLCIGGAGVARGYWNRPRLTSEKFVMDRFQDDGEARLYQTGDLARFSPDGDIEFLGRRDHQVKVRGYRVELEEIEAVVARHPGVKVAAVAVETDPSLDNRLIAYAVPHGSSAALAGKRTMKLPNHLVVAHLNRSETDYIYREIFEVQAYLKHGITVTDGDCVVDVGANIGLFSLFVSQICGATSIHAFEPNPVVFDILQANMTAHCRGAKCFNFGLAAQAEDGDLTFFEGFSLLSGYHTDVETERSLVKTFIANQRNQGTDDAEELLSHADDLLADRFNARSVATRLLRLSAVIAEEAIERIDLLKINVEKSELDVLRGIDEADWAKIRQIVLEVDVAENLPTILDMLEQHGFESVVRQDVLLETTELCYVYAIRPSEDLELIVEEPTDTTLRAVPVVAETPPTPRDLHEYLSERLPQYMVPSSFVVVDALPLTANGKLDRRALENLAHAGQAPDYTFLEPGTATEKTLAAIWMELLDAERIGLQDDFFELGGHSLMATRMTSRVLKRLGVNLSITQIFTTTTLESLAGAIDELKDG